MQAVLNIFRPVLLYVERAFEFNKYLAGAGLAVFITVALLFLMVALISLGDTGIKTDNARKLADVIMPDRDIDTLYDDFEKPEEPDQQPEDIAQPELDLAPIEGVDVAIPKPKTNFAASSLGNTQTYAGNLPQHSGGTGSPELTYTIS